MQKIETRTNRRIEQLSPKAALDKEYAWSKVYKALYGLLTIMTISAYITLKYFTVADNPLFNMLIGVAGVFGLFVILLWLLGGIYTFGLSRPSVNTPNWMKVSQCLSDGDNK